MAPAKPSACESAAHRSCAEIRAWIVAELAQALKVDRSSIDACAPLYSLGVDSLTAITLTGALAEWLQFEVPATLMWDHGSIDAIAQTLGDPRAAAPPPGVVYLNPHGHRTPLFCFPGTRGHCVTFAPLAAHLGLDQPCYGLMAPGVEGEHAPLLTIEEIAAEMLRRVRLLQPRGPYQFAGYSFGGLIAFEAAQQAMQQGETVSLLVLYDTFTPRGYVTRPRWQRIALHAYLLATRGGRLDYVRSQLKRRRELRQAEEVRIRPPATEAEAREKVVNELERTNIQALDRYDPQPYRGHLLLLRATERKPNMIFFRVETRTNGWGPLAAGGLSVVDVPGTHQTLLRAEHAAAAARILRPYLLGATFG